LAERDECAPRPGGKLRMLVRTHQEVDARLRPWALLAGAAIVIAFVSFGPVLIELERRWSTQEEYSHGFLIPVIAAWLLWTRRHALLASVGTPSVAGLALIVAAIAMNIIGELSAVWILSQVAFVLTLMGIVLAIGGYSLLRATFVPLAYLLFAIPLPYFIDAALTLRLQLLSSELGVFFIRLFQIPVYLDGNVIDMGIYKLQVVEACSGLRYLYPLLSLSFLAAYLFQGRFWQRAIIFLSAIPIAIGMNGFRIGLVGFLVDRWGTQMAEGALHFFEGWVVFVGCSAMLAGEMYLLALFSGRRFFEVFHSPKITLPQVRVDRSALFRQIPILAALSFLCLGGIAIFLVSGRSELIPQREQFIEFPSKIGNWQGRSDALDTDTEQSLKLDDYVLANYTQPVSAPVNLYVAYYASQRKNESPHSPTVCLPGSGWIITQMQRKSKTVGGVHLNYNRVLIQKGSNRELVYYWFDERGRSVADEWLAKWYLLRDAIIMNRTDGALVRLTTQITRAESVEEADDRLQSFMRAVVPHLTAFLPTTAANRKESAVANVSEPHS